MVTLTIPPRPYQGKNTNIKEAIEMIHAKLLQELNETFSGKTVKITSTIHKANSNEAIGVCKMFHVTESGIDIELMNGSKFGLVPEKITNNSVEGGVINGSISRRKIELA